MSTSSAAPEKGDWSPQDYLCFQPQRDRPARDLIHFLEQSGISPKRIVDLGCGPGNSTSLLRDAFPAAHITGVDNSPSMLSSARAKLLSFVDFVEGDLRTYQPDSEADLLFSNAAFHWLRSEDRIPTMQRLLGGLKPGGVLAIQVPDNYHEPSHRTMREVGSSEPFWSQHFQRLARTSSRPQLDPIEDVRVYFDRMMEYGDQVEIWHTHYRHVLDSHDQIFNWVKSTGLRPFLDALPDPRERENFSAAYRERLKLVYPALKDGSVVLTYPRLFMVASRGNGNRPH